MPVMYKEIVSSLVQTISGNAALLERKVPEMVAFLQEQMRQGKSSHGGGAEGQGTGNKVTDQEACFADVITKQFGFQILPKDAQSIESGLYYKYQLKGSQQSLDFGLYEYEGGVVKNQTIVDLKHTNSKKFYLNDGWFEKGVIYIINWNTGTKKNPILRAHIVLGQDIYTPEEQACMEELIAFKRSKNTETKNVGSLYPYIRFANQYSCERFTSETATAHLNSVLANI